MKYNLNEEKIDINVVQSAKDISLDDFSSDVLLTYKNYRKSFEVGKIDKFDESYCFEFDE